MLSQKISEKILKNLSSLQISPKKQENGYSHNKSIKSYLVDNNDSNDFILNDINSFKVDLNSDDYSEILFHDYYFSNNRILEQKKNIDNLLGSGSQVAWILISVYYCNFFAANEISKLYGQYVINFSKEDMFSILASSNYANPIDLIDNIETNNSYQIKVSQSEYEGFVSLNFIKSSPKPHEAVWRNLANIIEGLKVSDSLKQQKTVLGNILNKKRGWESPNKIRNDWNYKHSEFFDEKGTEISKKFIQLINNENSAYNWAEKRDLNPHLENIVASMAYLYEIMIKTNIEMNRRFDV